MNIDSETKIMQGIYDCIFKAIMLDKDNRNYLRMIINFITGIPLEKLKNIVVEGAEHAIEHKKMRNDIIVSFGYKTINLEMNNEYYDELFYKNDTYVDKILSNIYEGNDDYYKDTRVVIQIFFDDFTHFKEEKEVYKFVCKEYDLDIILPESAIKYYVDLNFIRKKWYNEDVSRIGKFEKYMLMLIAKTDKFAERIAGNDNILKKVSEKLSDLNKDKRMIELYDAEKELTKVMRTKIKYAENVGLEEGIKIIVKNMVNEGFDIKTITKITGLSKTEIEEI